MNDHVLYVAELNPRLIGGWMAGGTLSPQILCTASQCLVWSYSSGPFRSKLMVVDRRVACFRNANFSRNSCVESFLVLRMRGPIVQIFDIFLITDREKAITRPKVCSPNVQIRGTSSLLVLSIFWFVRLVLFSLRWHVIFDAFQMWVRSSSPHARDF